jgi:hypothetical protein
MTIPSGFAEQCYSAALSAATIKMISISARVVKRLADNGLTLRGVDFML